MPRTALFILMLLYNISGLAQGEVKSINGKVLSLVNNEALINASVYSPDFQYTTLTNEFGEFSLLVDSSTNFLIASYVGFNSDTINTKEDSIFFLGSKLLDIDITITASEIKNKQDQIGLITMPISLSRQLPQLFGTTDVIKSLSLYPGISLGIEGFSGLFVRGGGPGQNLMLLDGNKIYNSSHLFGFNSVFNPLVVKSVDLYKGGYPAQYGDRLSSIVRVNTQDGNPEKYETTLSVGLLESAIAHNGPIKKLKATYSIAARYSYLSLLTLPNRISYNMDKSQRFFDYQFYDVNAKLSFQLSQNQKLKISYFRGEDFISIKDKLDADNESVVGIRWGNEAFNIRYFAKMGESSELDLYLNYSRYGYQLRNENFLFENKSRYINNSENFEPSLGLNWKSNINKAINMVAGGNINYQDYLPYESTFSNISENDTILYFNTDKYRFNQYHFYGGLNFNFSKSLSLNSSLRVSNYDFSNTQKLYYSPRIMLSYRTKNFKSSLSYDRMNQFEHLLLGNGGGLPNEIWVPSTEQLIPQNSDQYALGLYFQVPTKSISFNVDLFHRRFNNQTLYFLTYNSILDPDLNWLELLVKNGDGRISGLEFFALVEKNRYQYSVSYTYLHNQRRFPEFNKNRWFESSYSRRNDLQFNLNYIINEKWSSNFNFIYSTGYYATLPTSSFYGVTGEITPVYDAWNNVKVRNYNRADIGFTYKKGKKEWKLGVYNFYGYQNPMFYQHESNYLVNDSSFPNSIGEISQIWGNAPLLFIPYVTYQYSF